MAANLNVKQTEATLGPIHLALPGNHRDILVSHITLQVQLTFPWSLFKIKLRDTFWQLTAMQKTNY